jgi:hypothetical protein
MKTLEEKIFDELKNCLSIDKIVFFEEDNQNSSSFYVDKIEYAKEAIKKGFGYYTDFYPNPIEGYGRDFVLELSKIKYDDLPSNYKRDIKSLISCAKIVNKQNNTEFSIGYNLDDKIGIYTETIPFYYQDSYYNGFNKNQKAKFDNFAKIVCNEVQKDTDVGKDL